MELIMTNGIPLMGDVDYAPDAMFTPQKIIHAAGGAAVYDLGDDALMDVRFYKKKVIDKKLTNEAGIVYKEAVYCRIQRPGDKSTVVDQPVKEEWIRRWPRQYQAFLQGQDQTLGTRLDELVRIGLLLEDQVKLLEISGVRTIEQAAAASDTIVASWGTDGNQIRVYCRGYLNQKVKAEAQAKDDNVQQKLEETEAKMAEMEELIKKLQGPKEEPNKRGRSKKDPQPEPLIIEEPAS
jgi:hypothetical protein